MAETVSAEIGQLIQGYLQRIVALEAENERVKAVAILMAQALVKLGCQKIVMSPCRKFHLDTPWCDRCQALASFEELDTPPT